MKTLTARHLEALEHAEIDAFAEKMVGFMSELDLDYAFPNKKEEYKRFAKIAYRKSLKYGLETEADIHAFVMAWHALGKEMCKVEWLMKIIKNNDNFNWEKREALLCVLYEKLDEMEGM